MKLIIYICILFLPLGLSARKEVNIWYFGQNAGLDFSSGKPIAITNGKLNSDEGCATLSDRNGKLLFYTDGRTVWNKEHNVMPNGTGLLGHASSTQSSVIVPIPESDSLYYIFTTDDKDGNKGFRYTLVNMQLDSGRGSVIDTIKNVLLFAPSAEKVAAVNNSGCSGVWVISHEWNSNNFRTYLVNPNGIDTNYIISSTGIKYDGTIHNKKGYLKAYSGGTKLAAASGYTSTFEVFDFDNKSGKISNAIKLTSDNYEAYGVEFSPDGSKLYATVNNRSGWFWDENELWQYNLKAGNQGQIAASKRTIATQSLYEQYGALQLGVDGKIYVAREGQTSLGVINNPNASGSACNYNSGAVSLAGRTCVWGLPFFIQSYFENKSFIRLPEKKALVGTVDLPFEMKAQLNCGNTDTLLLSYEATLKFDAKIFYFTSIEGSKILNSEMSSDGIMTLTISADSIRLNSEPSTLAIIKGDVLLGWYADTTTIDIVDFKWLNNNVGVDTLDGFLTAFGVCKPDIRRVIPIGEASLQIKPNPVVDEVEFLLREGAYGEYELEIFNVNGVLVWSRKWHSDSYSENEKVFKTDLKDISAGIYLVKYQTPLTKFIDKIIVIK